MRVVLDASATLAWMMPAQSSASTEAIFDIVLREGADVPAIWQFEVVSVLRRAVAAGPLTEAKALEFIALLDRLDIRVEAALPAMNDLFKLAQQQSLSGYDGAYLDLALRGHDRLATLDQELIAAATACGVEVIRV